MTAMSDETTPLDEVYDGRTSSRTRLAGVEGPTIEEVTAMFADPKFPTLPPGCGSPHPDQEGLYCERPAPCYGYHLSTVYDPEKPFPVGIDWPNAEMPPKRESAPSKAKGMADRVETPKAPADALPHSPSHRLYEADGPMTSKVAAVRTEITRQGQLRQTAEFLDAHAGEWIPGPVFNTPEVGGQDGTRRVRELRENYNWPIENRPMAGSTTWEYRLAPVPQLVDGSGSNPEDASHVGSTPAGGTSSVTVEP